MAVDWFFALAFGGFKLSDMDDKHVKINSANNAYGLTVQKNEIPGQGTLPVSLGVSYNYGKFHSKIEAGINAMAALDMNTKDLWQGKIGFGYEIFNDCVVSVIGGVQWWSMGKVVTNAKAPDGDESPFYISSDKAKRNGDAYKSTFWGAFVGPEVKYRLQDHVHLVGSMQFGLYDSHDEKEFYMLADKHIPKKGDVKELQKGEHMPSHILVLLILPSHLKPLHHP